MMSGRVRTRLSLHPSRDLPPKSSGVGWCSWMFVPMAPSNTSTRCEIARKYALPDSTGDTAVEREGAGREGAEVVDCDIDVIQKRKARHASARAGALANYLTWPQVA